MKKSEECIIIRKLLRKFGSFTKLRNKGLVYENTGRPTATGKREAK